MIGFDWSEWAILRFVGASSILWLCYYLLFDRKAPFSQCRIYLLYSVMIAGVVSIVRIPVYPTPQAVYVSPVPTVAREEMEQRETIPLAIPPETEKSAPTLQVPSLPSESSMQEAPFYASLDGWLIAKILYGLGVCVLLIYLFFEMIRIWRLKRWGSHAVDPDGICIVRNNQVVSPFSFWRTIFINRKIEGEVLHTVLLHEKAHISNRHYRDTFLIECLCILCWFNPFVWLIKRELRALHEFQVDRSMLSDNIELSDYQRILFEELMGYSPNIANGFHNSLIKKRFIMMKHQYKERSTWMRKLTLLFLLAGMIALFSFTEKSVSAPEPTPSVQKEEAEESSAQVEVTPSLTEEEKVVKSLKTEESVPAISLSLGRIKIKERDSEEVTQKTIVQDAKDEADLRPDQQVISRAPFLRKTSVRFVECTPQETRVTIAVPVAYDKHWIQFEKGLSIVDEDTRDVYRIRSITRDIKVNKVYWIVGIKGRMAEFTMVFPPLNKKVKEISIRDCFPEEKGMTPPNGSSWGMDHLNVRELAPTQVRMEEYDKEGRPLRADFPEEVTLHPDQVVISPYQRDGVGIVKIVPSDENTLVVLSLLIQYDRQWFTVEKGLCITDCKTGTEYPIQGVTNGIELNKLLWVEGCRGRSILVTLIFPKLDKRVKIIDLYSKYPDGGIISPLNGGKWRWEKIKIKDYQKEEYNNVYL